MSESVAKTTEATKVGFFGKLPKHGDFLSRRLPRTFTDPWDRWLQNAIADSREQLADDWLNIYLTSPLWRFALSPGLCGDSAWTGILMPSVDRVGRYFPLTLAAPLTGGCNLMTLAADNESWFDRCEELALGALQEDYELDAFDLGVEALGLPTQQDELQATSKQRATKPAWHFELPSLEGLDIATNNLNQALLKKLMPAHSLWWTHGSEHIEPSLLITEGFPPIEGYAGLLGGNWAEWGWENFSAQGNSTA
ncbi:MAG: type VI secretion system-associated protein TagF [Candidatus Sedimenticola sp. (ex Thyasira tokunagai)]